MSHTAESAKAYYDKNEALISDNQQLGRIRPDTAYRIRESVRLMTLWLVVLLAFRGMMVFLAAAQSNRLVNMLEMITGPLVYPFKQLFAYDSGIFEVYTLVAMLFYGIIGWSVVQIVTIVSLSDRG